MECTLIETGIVSQNAKNLTKSKKTATHLKETIDESGVLNDDSLSDSDLRSFGKLLNLLASKFPYGASTVLNRKILCSYIVSKKFTSNKQLNAAFKFIKTLDKDDLVNSSANIASLHKLCGVGKLYIHNVVILILCQLITVIILQVYQYQLLTLIVFLTMYFPKTHHYIPVLQTCAIPMT